jgi:hypothetical protein
MEPAKIQRHEQSIQPVSPETGLAELATWPVVPIETTAWLKWQTGFTDQLRSTNPGSFLAFDYTCLVACHIPNRLTAMVTFGHLLAFPFP